MSFDFCNSIKPIIHKAEELLSKSKNKLKEKTQDFINTPFQSPNSMPVDDVIPPELLNVTQVSTGIFWLQVPEANLYILCGCPAEAVKHLMRSGFISSKTKNNISFETGPNIILLSDLFVQHGNFSNLAEFPVLHMLYRQGMILPDHPNNTGIKPTIIGDSKQLNAQLKYIHRGNYGLLSASELMESGIEADLAKEMMKIKNKFAFGTIKSSKELVDQIAITEQYTEIRNGLHVRRLEINQFEFTYKNQSVAIDLNLYKGAFYSCPYTLDYHNIPRENFAVIHSGEGDGWDLNRPSMSSIIVFQGKIYLIDAPPNIIFILEKLGVDLSEINGIFHTHIHDDHFSGLPNLILSGRKIKYFATPMVRMSTSKKLAALLSMNDSCLADFFEVHDLIPDQWNPCEGMAVRPIYSPHPVENSFFIFKADAIAGDKTYAHLADLTQFKVLDEMKGITDKDVSEDFINKVKTDYLVTVDVKKIDIGGGLIHGDSADFINDDSKKILLAHIARPLTDQEKQIGSAAPFGSLDILIHSQHNYLRQQAIHHLRAIFPQVPLNQLDSLLIAPIILINPGSVIRHKHQQYEHVDLILTGVVEYIHEQKEMSYTLSNCSLIGDLYTYSENAVDTWRARSHVNIMRLSTQVLHAFLKKTGLEIQFKKNSQIISFLLTTWLFREKLPFALLSKIASATQIKHLKSGEALNINRKKSLFLIKSGSLTISNNLTITEGQFVGEENFLEGINVIHTCQANTETELYLLEGLSLKEIPIVYWKILETANKRHLIEGYIYTKGDGKK